MHTLYLGLGSNQGDRQALLQEAIAQIGERIGQVERVSDFIETEPWGFQSENQFLNACCKVATTLSPQDCLQQTQEIERAMGRTAKSRGGQYHDRLIDIDLLLYDDLHITTPTLTIPHPHMYKRDFVMIPLRQIQEQETK